MRLNKELIITFSIICIVSLRSQAQHKGGIGDGFNLALYSSSTSIFTGSASDGYDLSKYMSPHSIYEGLAEDGFAITQFASSVQYIFTGADHDGFGLSVLHSTGTYFAGGSNDGFEIGKYLHYHKWTGLVGTGWLVAGNWEHNIVPTDSIRVRIPPGVPNIPKINAGNFKIGTAVGANFTCRALWIEPGGTMLCRVNALIENHSSLIIDGTFQWKNPVANSFTNKPGASILIRNGGVLKSVL